MDEYDLIVERTVRDLFKSNQLIQIKKYKMNKEKEINDKDDDLKELILQKYSDLTESINGLEKISNNLKELEEIRVQLGENLSKIDLDKIENILKGIKFDINFISEEENNNDDIIDEKIDECYQLLKTKEYQQIINDLKTIKLNLKEEKHEDYNFLVIDLTEEIMKNFIEEKNLINNLEIYKNLFEQIDENIFLNDESKNELQLSEFYLKINNDEGINQIFHQLSIGKGTFSTNIIIKLLILNITKNLVLISQERDYNFIKEENKNLIMKIYQMLITIVMIINQYIINNENKKEIVERINEFIQLMISQIKSNIDSMFVLDNSVDDIKIKTNQLISFWTEIKNDIKDNISEKELNIINFMKDNNIISNEEFFYFLFLNKAIDQVSNVVSRYIKKYSSSNFKTILSFQIKKENFKFENEFYSIIKKISSLENDIYKEKLIQIIFSQLETFLNDFLENINQNKVSIDYFNFMMKILSYDDLNIVIKELKRNNLLEIINKILVIYAKNNFSKIEQFINNTFKNYLKYENYSNPEQETNDNIKCSESLKEMILYIYSFEIKEEKYKLQIYNILYDVYEKFIQSYSSVNKHLYIDLFVLKYIKIQNNIGEIKDFNQIISLIESRTQNNFNFEEEKIKDIIGYNELNDFFNKINYYDKNISFPVQNNFIKEKNKFKKEQIMVTTSRLNPLFLNRRKVNYNYSDNSKNTTSKILEHRIDESYLSLRTSKISPQPQNPHNTTFPKKSSTNPLQFFKFN
jgi:hypothetical protein